MKKSLLILMTVAMPLLSFAVKEEKYPVSAIPPELKADAVVRDDEMTFTILSKSKATLKVHYAVTIFNANFKDRAVNSVGYDKNVKVASLKGAVYDANGELIKKLKTGDIYDYAPYESGTLFSDNRAKAFDLSHNVYPYTIEYEYELDFSYLYSIPGSAIQGSENMSVQHFRYELIYPKSLKPRYKAYNLPLAPQVKEVGGGNESTTWDITNVKPTKFEPYWPKEKVLQRIEAAPTDFEYSGYSGSMATWNDYAKWQAQLNQGRDMLPPATVQKLNDLTKNLKTTEEKAKAVYEYMQSKTRYVSIQLGIGGLQPFDATTVDQNGYGDCKALSNYMVAMLKQVGVKGYYTTIMAGENARDVDTSFPSHQGNHVIVGVPNGRDTLWLECTSQTTPFGYIGQFTDDRYGLMVTEAGGKLVKTRAYKQELNVQVTKAEVVLDMNGNAKATIKRSYSGLQYENDDLNFILHNSADEQKKWVQRTTDIPSFDISSFKLTENRDIIPSATLDMSLVMNRFASVNGKRIFMSPNLMSRWKTIPEKNEERKNPIEIKTPWIDQDTITYSIPEGIYPEFVPTPTKIESQFGTYEVSYKLDQGKLIYSRKMSINSGKFPPQSYQQLIDFYRAVNKADNVKLVFLNKT